MQLCEGVRRLEPYSFEGQHICQADLVPDHLQRHRQRVGVAPDVPDVAEQGSDNGVEDVPELVFVERSCGRLPDDPVYLLDQCATQVHLPNRRDIVYHLHDLLQVGSPIALDTGESLLDPPAIEGHYEDDVGKIGIQPHQPNNVLDLLLPAETVQIVYEDH